MCSSGGGTHGYWYNDRKGELVEDAEIVALCPSKATPQRRRYIHIFEQDFSEDK